MRIIPIMRSVMAAALLLSALTACSSGASGDGSQVSVVASFYPLAYVAERVAGDRAGVLDLTHPGQEPHDLELGVQATADLEDADVVVYERGLQAAVDEAVDQADPDHVVDAASVADLEGDDPHFWLDPLRLSSVATAVAAELEQVDPDHAQGYRRRLADLRRDLQRLDDAYRTGLQDCRVRTVVVSHDAFGYLGKYGLKVAAINGLSPDAEPSPAHLAELQQLARREGVTTVFSETLASPDLARTLAQDLGIRTAVLDPIEGLSDATADEDYLSLMRADLQALRQAGSCR
jgi:zinc transport system substrate-binding protein